MRKKPNPRIEALKATMQRVKDAVKKKWMFVATLPVAVTSGLLIGGLLAIIALGFLTQGSANHKPPTTSLTHCDSWAIQKQDHGDTRWFAEGIAAIDKATTESEARDAADTWLNRVKLDPLLLQSAAKTFLEKDVKQVDLTNKACGSEEAVQTVIDIQTEIANSKVSAVASAPEGTITTGVEDGEMRSLPTSGHDRAIEIIRPSGKRVWIERDCGNTVTEHREFHWSKKHKHHKPPPRHRCPWPLTNGKCLQPKNPNEDPQRRGNVPEQVKGKNPPVEGGPSAPKVEKPTKPYTPPPPPPPAPDPPKDSQPEPDPEPPPPPEPDANPDDGGGNSGDPGGF